ncbi:MAG: ATP-binding cassette domain-containing protein [Pseudomonadota bacterium]
MSAPLLSLRNATVRIGPDTVFDDLTLSVGKGDQVCLVGRNGAGKSTLLRALAGLTELDVGERFVQPRINVAYLEQEPDFGAHDTILEIVAAGLRDRHDLHRAESVLARFDLDPARRATTLSGGEERRAALARALVDDPEILLLDEPTNHLDLKAIEELEQDLARFRGGLVMVSHDRAFLTQLSRSVWWLDRGRLWVLDDNFAAFDAWSDQLLEDEEKELRQLERTIATETTWSHQGITARRKRNQGRLRRLEALRQERRGRAPKQGQVKLTSGAAPSAGKQVIEAEGISKRFGNHLVVDDFSSRILRGDRIGIIGPSGAGKTTLLRLLTGQLAPDQGAVRLGTNLQIAFVDQRRDSLDPDWTPWRTLCPDGGDQVLVHGRWRHVASYLSDFLFRPTQFRTPLRVLSGGERNRLLLAKQLAQPCNLMVLDEPTNDLDMDTLDLLQETIAEFDGTVLLVSHDRNFLDRLVTSTITFEGNGKLREYAGGYSDYLAQRGERAIPEQAKPKRARRLAANGPRKTDKKPQRELTRLVTKIEVLQERIREIEQRLADPDLFGRDPVAFAASTEELASLQRELERAEERWLELEIAIEGSG